MHLRSRSLIVSPSFWVCSASQTAFDVTEIIFKIRVISNAHLFAHWMSQCIKFPWNPLNCACLRSTKSQHFILGFCHQLDVNNQVLRPPFANWIFLSVPLLASGFVSFLLQQNINFRNKLFFVWFFPTLTAAKNRNASSQHLITTELFSRGTKTEPVRNHSLRKITHFPIFFGLVVSRKESKSRAVFLVWNHCECVR